MAKSRSKQNTCPLNAHKLLICWTENNGIVLGIEFSKQKKVTEYPSLDRVLPISIKSGTYNIL